MIIGADAVLALPPKKKKWVVIGSVFFIILAFIIIFSVFRAWKSTSLPRLNKVSQESDQETKNRRIDELVAALIKDYRENRKTGKGESSEAGQSGLPTLVFLNIKANGITEADKEYIFTGITDTLRSSKRVKVVEREILDKLLEELKLSSSQLADPAKILEVGKILSAQMISTGSISRDGGDWLVSLRLVDTETTSIQAALTEKLETKDREDVAEILSREILNKIRTAYPLQGKILSFEKNEVVLNIGFKDGVTLGSKMSILSGAEGRESKIGAIEITSVNENTSTATITEKHDEYKEGYRVEELL